MEIDAKKEQEIVEAEMEGVTKSINQITAQEDQLSQQKQVLIQDLLKKQGELELLQRLEKG